MLFQWATRVIKGAIQNLSSNSISSQIFKFPNALCMSRFIRNRMLSCHILMALPFSFCSLWCTRSCAAMLIRKNAHHVPFIDVLKFGNASASKIVISFSATTRKPLPHQWWNFCLCFYCKSCLVVASKEIPLMAFMFISLQQDTQYTMRLPGSSGKKQEVYSVKLYAPSCMYSNNTWLITYNSSASD